tara:strand:- start:47 stop:553 length:507 start_codon:yes stop_codon:yes gene_type:complete
MENEIENKTGTVKKIFNILIEKKKIFISIFILIILFVIGLKFLDYYKQNLNREISEKYIKAGILLSSNKKEESKKIYIEIIESKNSFYSILALNNIIENNLEKNSDEVLKLFESVENIKIKKDRKNLVKLKKALFFFKISKFDEGNLLLNQIIADDSKWKNIASELIK